jgi:hypothetical protein
MGDLFCPFAARFIEERREVVLDHRCAGARRHNRRLEWLYCAQELATDGPSLFTEAAVESGLPTASPADYLDLIAQCLEYSARERCVCGAQRVHVTRHNQGDSSHPVTLHQELRTR